MRRKIRGVLRAPRANSQERYPGSITSADISPGYVKVVSGALASGNADAFAFAWQNPEDESIIVHRVLVDVTTAGGTGSSVLDVGKVAGATATADTLIDGADLNAVAVYDSADSTLAGTNGRGVAKLDKKGGTNDHITGKILTQNAASLAGKYYIFYTRV